MTAESSYLFPQPRTRGGRAAKRFLGAVLFENTLARAHMELRREFYRSEMDEAFEDESSPSVFVARLIDARAMALNAMRNVAHHYRRLFQE
jgi:hypothetical protein